MMIESAIVLALARILCYRRAQELSYSYMPEYHAQTDITVVWINDKNMCCVASRNPVETLL